MANHKMTFEVESGITKAKIDGVYMGGGKAAQVEASEEQIKDVIEDTVKANPEMEGGEPNLEGLELSGDKYAVPQGGGGTTVVANPTLVGDEADLTGLEVEGVKYKVPQGGGIEFVEIDYSTIRQDGSITQEQAAALRNGAFVKLHIGDVNDSAILLKSNFNEWRYTSTPSLNHGAAYFRSLVFDLENLTVSSDDIVVPLNN